MADKQKYLDYDGTAVLKNKILEKFDDKISDIDDTLANTVKSYKARDLILNYANNVNDYLSGENLSSDVITVNTNNDNMNILSATFETDKTNFICQCQCFIIDASTSELTPVLYFETVPQDSIVQNEDGTYTINVDCSDINFGTKLTLLKETLSQMGLDTDDTTLVQLGVIGVCITLINLDENLIPIGSCNIVTGENNVISNMDTSNVTGENNVISNMDTSNVTGENNVISNMDTSNVLGYENNIGHIASSLVAGERNIVHGQDFIPKSSFAEWSYDDATHIVTIKLLTEKLANIFQAGDFIYHCSWYGIYPSKVLTISTEGVYTIIAFNFNNALDTADILHWFGESGFYGILDNNTGWLGCTTVLGNYNGVAGSCSFASGFGNCCPTDYNFALGRHCSPLGQHSFSTGWGNVSASDNSFSCGSFCKYDENAAFQVGNGTGVYHRVDLLNLSKEGKLTIADDLVYNGNTSLSAKIEEIGINIKSLSPVVYDCIVNESFASNSHIIVYENESIVTINVYLYTTEDVSLIADDVIISGLPPSDNANGGFTYEGNTISFVINNNGDLKSLDDHTIVANTPIIGTYIYKKSTLNENLVFTLNSASIEDGEITDFEKDGVSYPVTTNGTLTVDESDDGIVFDGSQSFMISLNGDVLDTSRSIVMKFKPSENTVSGKSYNILSHANIILEGAMKWGTGHTGFYYKATDSDGYLLADIGITNTVKTSDNIKLYPSTIHTLVSVYDKDNAKYKIYLDSVLVKETTSIANSGITFCDYLGNTEGNNPFVGKMYELSLYDKALTAEEIASL